MDYIVNVDWALARKVILYEAGIALMLRSVIKIYLSEPCLYYEFSRRLSKNGVNLMFKSIEQFCIRSDNLTCAALPQDY